MRACLALLAFAASVFVVNAQAAKLMCIDDDVVQFGNRPIGSHTSASISVTNCGSESWSFTNVGVHPATGAAFHIDSTCTTGLVLAPGGACAVNVDFAPFTVGETSGGYVLQNTSSTPSEVATFYGRGIDQRAGTASVVFEPAAAEFAAQPVGTPAAPLPMILRNLGPATLTPSAEVFTGPAAHDFSRPVNPCPSGTPIPAGGACEFLLAFQPQALGTRLANLVFDAPELASLAILPIRGVGSTATIGNATGLWWNASQAGWGVYFAHQADTIFAIWFTYGAEGEPQWFVAVLKRIGPNVYAGALVSVTGPAFGSVPFDASQVVEKTAGTMSVTFSGANSATLAYTIFGIDQTKTITRMQFADTIPACVWGAQADLARAINFQDLWWNAPAGSEPGWGIGLTHEGDVIFATWFTYGAEGKPRWLIAVAVRTGPNTYAGTLSTVTGPPFFPEPFDPSKVIETVVGDAIFTFADGNHATFSYTQDGATQTRQITRQVFAPPGTACND
jgi:hypothetical protein